jgi:hypothetical protein
MKNTLILSIILIFTGSFWTNQYAQENQESFRVKYLSAENVYLDAGKLAGLKEGDQLTLKRQNQTIARIQIIYVSDYSASAVILESKGSIEVGDLAFPDKTKQVEPVEEKTTAGDTTSAVNIIPPPPTTIKRTYHPSPFSGTISMQYYYWKDLDATRLNFSQPTVRLSLRGKRLWGKEYYLRVRARLRHNQRARQLNPNAPESQWRNRIFEVSFSYEDNAAIINYQVGRIISNKFSGVGYIDGLLVQYNTGSLLRLGVFAGTQPEWQYAEFQTSIQKYGVYSNLLSGDYSSGRFESTLALTGEYHGKTVSREFIYLQNSYYRANKWSIYQSAELDINRGWRKEISGNRYSLTNLYISGQWNFSPWLMVGAMYDNRKNYLTYETRSLADSLFSDIMRQGVRTNVTFILPKNYRVYGNFGIRKRKTDVESTYSYGGGLSQTDFIFPRTRLFLNAAGFTNFFTNGITYSAMIGKYLINRVNFDLGFGGYRYSLKASQNYRNNQWVRVITLTDFLRRLYLSGQYEYDWGDDVNGHRLLLELGYRL